MPDQQIESAGPTPPQLPTELWIKVLSHLDYYRDMKKCWLNNSLFRQIIDVDEKLSRVIYRSRDVFEEHYRLEPVLRRFDFHPAMYEADPHCCNDDMIQLWGGLRLLETTMSHEQATRPAVECLRLKISPACSIRVCHAGGITVYHLLRALGSYVADPSNNVDWIRLTDDQKSSMSREQIVDRIVWDEAWDYFPDCCINANGRLWLEPTCGLTRRKKFAEEGEGALSD